MITVADIEAKMAAKLGGKFKIVSDFTALEKDGALWAKEIFPHLFSRPFTTYQKEFWKWADTIEPDTRYRPRIECQPRGVGKSTNAEAAVVKWVATKKRKMIGYVSLNDQKATKHFDSIKSMLEDNKFLSAYPHCKPGIQKLRDVAAQWSRDAIVTESGAMIVPLSLQGSSRGWKSSTGSRFDCFPAGTLIKTEIGHIPIESFPMLQYVPKVYAFNHATQQVELQDVEGWRQKNARRLVEITTKQGRVFRCTEEHRIFINTRGYIQAKQVRVGETLNVLPTMLWQKESEGVEMQALRTDRQFERQDTQVLSLVSEVPHVLPQIERDEVSMVRFICDESVPVYDLQVAGCHNFFANEVLVHNCIVLDDIDELGQSVEFTRKLINILKGEILAAGNDNTLVLMPQNLIYRDSICSQILDHRADILSDRIFCGPYPLLKWYDAEKLDLDDGTGAKQWVITAGEAYDDAIDLEYAQKLLNTFGKSLFDRECQQDVKTVEDDKDFREWDERYHLITYSEFRRVMEDVWNSERNRLQIPNRWNVGMGFDWGTTKGHPSAVALVARPPQTTILNDCHFVFAEVIKPKFPLDAFETPEMVSPGRVAKAIQDELREWNVNDSQVTTKLLSHEASAALNTMAIDLQDDIKMFWGKWKAKKGSGVPQIQNLLEIDYERPHPFRVYPEGHPKAGQPLMGRPRLYFLVEDSQGDLWSEGANLFVRGGVNSKGFARARFEMPLYSHKNTGENKIDDDFCFVAGTLIRTDRGNVPIEQVGVGDLVYTRSGLRRVINAGMTNLNAVTYTARFSNGLSLVATGSHPVFTEKGIVAFRGIMGAEVYKWKERSLSLTARSFTAIQTPVKHRIVNTFNHIYTLVKRGFRTYTSKYGNRIMAMFPMGVTSTTRITTITTTILSTLSAYRGRNIFANTLKLQAGAAGVPINLNTSTELELWRPNGIRVTRAGNGTVNTVNKLGWIDQKEKGNASIARLNFHRKDTIENTAPICVNIARRQERVWRWLQSIVSRVRHLLRFPLQTVARFCVGAVAIEKLRVESVVENPYRQPVYNLTVGGDPEYFANDILVHNCDAFRGLMNVFGVSAKAPTVAEQIYAAMPDDLKEANIKSSEQRMAQVIRMEKEIEKVERRRNTDEWEFSR